MSDKTRTSLLSLAIIIVLVFSAVSPIIVYADDGTTSDEPPTEVASNPDEATTEEGKDDANSGEEVTPPKSTEEAPLDPDSSILKDIPDNTVVAVLDTNGELQPLATQDTADSIATSDPIWCPGSQGPTPGANGCTESFTSFDGLLTFLSGNSGYQGAGTIYVQQGEYHGNDPNNIIDFNAAPYDLSNIRNSNLTVTGGWNTSNNTIDPASPSTFSDYSILIGSSTNPWGGSLTINNISMKLSRAPDPQMSGLTLYTQGDIVLSNVSVSEAPNNGAELHADGDVNVQNSSFDRNRGAGGAIIDAGGDVAIANSTFGNLSEYRQQVVGLDIVSGGSTSLFAVLANNNREVGTNINAGGRVTIGNSFFSGTKEMYDSENGTVFLGYGLQVVTPDAIDIDNVTANDNFLWGASLEADGDIAISDSEFNANTTENPGFIDDTGLFITGGGNVALNNVTANDNRLYGAQIDATGTVSINNSTFNNNRGVTTIGGVTTYHGHGLQINSLADIFINNTNALNNMLFGGQLNADGEIAISNSIFSDTSTGSSTNLAGKGLEIVSAGNVSLASTVLDNNQTVGADVQAGADIFLDLVTATDNGTDGVTTQGTCTHVFGGTYSGNGQYGLNLGSSALDLMSPATFANNGVGDIFPENQVICSPSQSSGDPATNGDPTTNGAPAANGSAGASNLFTSASYYSVSRTVGSENVSLSSFLANTKTGNSSMHGTFIGKYAYVHSINGLQIIALYPISQEIAMVGSVP